MSKYSTSSDSVDYESNESDVSRAETAVEGKEKKRSSSSFMIIIGCLAVTFVVILGLSIAAVLFFTMYEFGSSNIPEGKKVIYNRVTYNKDSNKITESESSFLFLNEDEYDYSKYEVTPVNSPSDVFFITEEPMSLECEVSCCCYNYDLDERRGFCSSGSCMTPKCWIAVGITVAVLAVGGIICSKKCCKKCEQKCKEEGYDTGEAKEIECVEPTSGIPVPQKIPQEIVEEKEEALPIPEPIDETVPEEPKAS